MGMANRHGLITGATGTGKTVSLQTLAENFSNHGVPVFMADVKGDLVGISQTGHLSDKLKAIEAEANDAEIQTIRKNLDALRSQAEAKTLDALPAAGDALKTSFVKVYLKRG